MRDIGKNIKTLRQRRNITQEELAEKLFVTRQTVSNYELGHTRPDIDMLMKISEVLGEDMNALLYGPPETVSRTRQIVKTCIAGGLLVLLVIFYSWFAQWALIRRNNFHIMTPFWLNHIFLKPGLLLFAGWFALQLLSTFFSLQPLPKKSARPLFISTLSLIGLYLLAVMPITVATLSSWESINGWYMTVGFYAVGYYPRQPFPDLYLLLSFLAGSMLWLAGCGVKKRQVV